MPWYDPRVPAAETCVLRPLLERRAAEMPDKVFVRLADGTEWTYRQTLEITRRTAAGSFVGGWQNVPVQT